MAGYYDANKDYSKAISEAKAAGKDTTQLEMERQNKIDDKYGGKEPNMIGSDKTFSQLSGGSSSSGSNATMGGSSSKITSGIGSSNTNRNTALAGQSVKDGQYTVTYDDRGYIVKTVKDGGASATSTVKTTHADDSANHRLAYQAAQAGDWDSVGRYINQIGMSGGKDQYGNYDMGAANSYLKELTDEFQYNAKDYYDSQYDKAYGAGSSAVFDATNGAVKTADQWAALTGGAAIPSQALVSGGNQAGGISSLEYGAGSDASQYIRDMYAQQQAAQLAALKSAYEQNVLDYQAQDDLISAEAQRQRNQAASQNDLQRMYMNEMGIMQGLNTGTTGQMALAQSAALQGNLASIGTQEQQSLSDSALERSKLKAQYSAAVDQAVAQNNYELANALYQEYVRQDNLAQQKAAADLEQQNWLAQFNYQKEQDALAQQNWQAQFDYQKAQDDLNYQLTLQKLYGANVGSTGSPVKTPSVGYNNGGLTSDQVKALQNYYGVTADGAWGKNSTNAAGGMTAAQAWEQFTAPVTDVSQLSANGIAVANSLARGYTTGTQQRDAIISAYQNGRITRGEAEFLARAVGASL